MSTEPSTTISRLPRVRLRTLLVVIAFLGLVFALVVQSVRHQQAEESLRSELELARVQAESSFQHAQLAVDQYLTKVTEQTNDGGESTSDIQRDSLKQTLKLYESAESNASTPEARARAREQARRIRSQLDGEHQ